MTSGRCCGPPVRGVPPEVVIFVVAAWAVRRGRARCQRGNGPLQRQRCHRLAPGDGARGTAAWSDIRPVASGLHADAVCGCPAGPCRDSSGDLWRRRRRHDDRRHDTGIRPTLRRPRPARVLGHGAALRRCVADRIRDAQELDQCIRTESGPAGALGRHEMPLKRILNEASTESCWALQSRGRRLSLQTSEERRRPPRSLLHWPRGNPTSIPRG